jgi:hypothetical protein
MRVSARCLLWRLTALSAALLLTGCPVRPQGAPVPPPAAPAPAARVGVPYDVAGTESLLTILVFKGGALAAAGHNHLIASHELSGTFYVGSDVLQTTFEVHIPVGTLSVDESALRSQEHSADFPPEVPDSAKSGTKHNMLGEALLDGEHHAEIVLRGLRLQEAQPPAPGALVAEMEALVRDEPHTLRVPVHYERAAGTLIVSGDMSVRQTDLGLKPFSAMLGALQVQDEMRVRFRIVAHESPTHGAAPR